MFYSQNALFEIFPNTDILYQQIMRIRFTAFLLNKIINMIFRILF
jgi:hypothetical protein